MEQPSTISAQPVPLDVLVPKRLNTGSEAVLGLLNGAVVGSLGAGAGILVEAVVQKQPGEKLLEVIKGRTHLGVAIGVGLGITAVNTGIRAIHASRHNAWADAVEASRASSSHQR